MAYTYRLRTKEDQQKKGNTYTPEELEGMPTFMLHDICVKEKIMTGQAGVPVSHLSRTQLTDLILRYRGKRLEEFVREFPLERSKEMLSILLKTGSPLGKTEIDIPSKIELFQGVGIEEPEGIRISCEGPDLFSYALLTEEEGRLLGVFHIRDGNSGRRLLLDKNRVNPEWRPGNYRNLYFYFLTAKTAAQLIPVYNGTGDEKTVDKKELFYSRVWIPNLSRKELLESAEPLVIDFGTSNTTAGVYEESGGLKKICFRKKRPCSLCSQCGGCYLCPSAAAVDRIDKNGEIFFLFGQEAMEIHKLGGLLTSQTMFYDMKRFVNDYEEETEVFDSRGNSGVIKKKEILRQYLLWIIKQAEEQEKCYFKKLCFTTPVKQKHLILSMYSTVLPEYEIQEKEAIDEGIAVLYHEIGECLKGEQDAIEPVRALIFDCGGGTSDMVCCDYSVENTGITYEIPIMERYSNGDTNFGGNNITYRIFQYIKIKLAALLEEKSADQLLSPEFFDPYNYVDQFGGSRQVYEEMERQYRKLEERIPTAFARELHNSMNQYLKIRNNFYSIWKIAEEVKKAFFQESTCFQIQVQEFCRGFHTVFVKGKSRLVEKEINMTLSKEEILTVITPDIYGLVKRFMEPLCDAEGVLEGCQIKLTGQTCKIPVFRDAIKEFTIGKRSRSGKPNTRKNELKLKCVEGAIKYQADKKFGYIFPEITYDSPAIPYGLTSINHRNEQVVLIGYLERLSQVYGYLSRPLAVREVRFSLNDKDGKSMNTMTLAIDFTHFQETNYEILLEQYGNKLPYQGDLDGIGEGELRLFVFCYEEDWGFHVLPIGKQNEILYRDALKYFPFESAQWEIDFFDGTK